jgi:hypothetical protein
MAAHAKVLDAIKISGAAACVSWVGPWVEASIAAVELAAEAAAKKRNGRHEETRTPNLYRVNQLIDSNFNNLERHERQHKLLKVLIRQNSCVPGCVPRSRSKYALTRERSAFLARSLVLQQRP